MKYAQIEYLNAPTDPTCINLHISTVSRLTCGALRTDAHDVVRHLDSKAAALAIAKAMGAQLV